MKIWGASQEGMIVRWLAGGAIAFFAFCFWYGLRKLSATDDRSKLIKFILWSIWTVGTPTYFLFEFCFIYDPAKGHAALGQYKVAMELASKIWLAVAAVLAALFAGKDFLAKIGEATGKQGG